MNIQSQFNISSQNNYQVKNEYSFCANLVPKIKPCYISDDVVILNNETAVLKKSAPFFKGMQKMLDTLNTLFANRTKRAYFFYPEDKDRVAEFMTKLPKEELKKRKMLGCVGVGWNNMAFKLDKNKVLCISDDMSFLDSRPMEDFDLPFIKKGNLTPDSDEGWFIRKLGKPVTEEELETLKTRIEEKGYETYDWRTDQACKVDDKIYLLDYECARPKRY
ncbi:MAG: hypothetical protein NC200_07730 [Candidatus Gastranaerophilales bacterium]|nr:hypothetical protein [Candidatus Gastranaerophilales bacterium]